VLDGGASEEATLIADAQPMDRRSQLRAAIEPARPIEPIDVRAQGSQPAIAPPAPQPRPSTDAPRPSTDAPRSSTDAPRHYAGASRHHAGAPRHHPTPPPQPYVGPRAPQLALGAPWQQLPPARRQTQGPSFDAARDAAVRNIVWALVLVLGCVLALIVAKLI
jgi:hypothetical protein